MYGFILIVSDNHLLIVGYYDADIKGYKGVYKMPVADITTSIDQKHNNDKSTKQTELTVIC